MLPNGQPSILSPGYSIWQSFLHSPLTACCLALSAAANVYLLILLVRIQVVVCLCIAVATTGVVLRHVWCHTRSIGLASLFPRSVNNILTEQSLFDIFYKIIATGRVPFYFSRLCILLWVCPTDDELIRILDGCDPAFVRFLLRRGIINSLPLRIQRLYKPSIQHHQTNNDVAVSPRPTNLRKHPGASARRRSINRAIRQPNSRRDSNSNFGDPEIANRFSDSEINLRHQNPREPLRGQLSFRTAPSHSPVTSSAFPKLPPEGLSTSQQPGDRSRFAQPPLERHQEVLELLESGIGQSICRQKKRPINHCCSGRILTPSASCSRSTGSEDGCQRLGRCRSDRGDFLLPLVIRLLAARIFGAGNYTMERTAMSTKRHILRVMAGLSVLAIALYNRKVRKLVPRASLLVFVGGFVSACLYLAHGRYFRYLLRRQNRKIPDESDMLTNDHNSEDVNERSKQMGEALLHRSLVTVPGDHVEGDGSCWIATTDHELGRAKRDFRQFVGRHFS